MRCAAATRARRLAAPFYSRSMSQRLVLISVGNSRTRLARVVQDQLEPSVVVDSADAEALAKAAADLARPLAGTDTDSDEVPIVIASVNHPAANRLEKTLLELAREDRSLADLSISVQRFGRDLAIPVQTTLEDESTVGQDRLLDALGAFARSKQACIVIDAGTAVTVDFVDGQGVFHGGIIAPGLSMMARALHEQTAGLPLVDVARTLGSLAGSTPDARSLSPRAGAPDGEGEEVELAVATPTGASPFGKTTAKAIALGCAGSVRGLVHHQIDRYAEFYGGYPRVIATGGDAPLLFEHDELIEAIVPDLTLVGMLEAVRVLREHEGDDGSET